MSGVYTKKCVDDVFDTSEGALPFKLQRIAEEELGETQAKRQDALEKLTQLLEGVWMPDELPYADLQCTWLICMGYIAADPAAQILGVVLLVDYADFTADKILSFSIGLIRRALEYIQDCMPMRMKAVHIVRQSYAFDLFFALIKPFIRTKLAERFRFHGENFEKLHEEISPKTLPEEYGGQGPPIDPDEFWKRVDAAEEDFAAANRFGYPMKDQDDLPPENEELKQELTSL
ncbi:clavesin-2 isoform X3 [Rhipicephalus sanguineus]|uniref:clavesin-2 isoform X3 n=1 Tax=Rhipicephalus sanguineus TaxID=34632 RepID=UPI0020C1F189|nr:clavesin-2 isoform X3 [Rhipicephalus sanguineus]